MRHPLLRRIPPGLMENYVFHDAINMHTEILDQILDRLEQLEKDTNESDAVPDLSREQGNP